MTAYKPLTPTTSQAPLTRGKSRTKPCRCPQAATTGTVAVKGYGSGCQTWPIEAPEIAPARVVAQALWDRGKRRALTAGITEPAKLRTRAGRLGICGCSSVVEQRSPKPSTEVRFLAPVLWRYRRARPFRLSYGANDRPVTPPPKTKKAPGRSRRLWVNPAWFSEPAPPSAGGGGS